ncbi:NUDIX domain-containing protein [Nocardiopsis gilva YIM 90087]|uniref:NUDIX domain-containing protein n=1 Tax=Nocardiopsis gilva YIM 90087 TaxID=1235441 RepID=A0A223SDR8_9ACTN|nr:NUDIX domain-containing protein [Nocardiopsis gilva]ASU86311.1 NUDIX domain-containing protein [Nocardiopsis gilva YIM 90087]
MSRLHPLNGAKVWLGGRMPDRYDSVVCLLFSGDRPVLVRNRDRAWEFPGGHAETGEDVEATARREAREEAGAKLADVIVDGYYVLASGHTTVVTHAQVAARGALSGEFETVEAREFDVLPDDLSWDDGLYAHLLRRLDLPGAPGAE